MWCKGGKCSRFGASSLLALTLVLFSTGALATLPPKKRFRVDPTVTQASTSANPPRMPTTTSREQSEATRERNLTEDQKAFIKKFEQDSAARMWRDGSEIPSRYVAKSMIDHVYKLGVDHVGVPTDPTRLGAVFSGLRQVGAHGRTEMWIQSLRKRIRHSTKTMEKRIENSSADRADSGAAFANTERVDRDVMARIEAAKGDARLAREQLVIDKSKGLLDAEALARYVQTYKRLTAVGESRREKDARMAAEASGSAYVPPVRPRGSLLPAGLVRSPRKAVRQDEEAFIRQMNNDVPTARLEAKWRMKSATNEEEKYHWTRIHNGLHHRVTSMHAAQHLTSLDPTDPAAVISAVKQRTSVQRRLNDEQVDKLARGEAEVLSRYHAAGLDINKARKHLSTEFTKEKEGPQKDWLRYVSKRMAIVRTGLESLKVYGHQDFSRRSHASLPRNDADAAHLYSESAASSGGTTVRPSSPTATRASTVVDKGKAPMVSDLNSSPIPSSPTSTGSSG